MFFFTSWHGCSFLIHACCCCCVICWRGGRRWGVKRGGGRMCCLLGGTAKIWEGVEVLSAGREQTFSLFSFCRRRRSLERSLPLSLSRARASSHRCCTKTGGMLLGCKNSFERGRRRKRQEGVSSFSAKLYLSSRIVSRRSLRRLSRSSLQLHLDGHRTPRSSTLA